tara:strand:- start:2257 stop:2550 length:294 start_codon:yes stop_codon:yes gene_type:complete
MKTWLKWGLIFAGIYLGLFLISFFLDLAMQPNGFLPLWFLLFPSLLLPFIGNCLLGGFSANPSPECNTTIISIILVVLNIAFYFLVGAIIGKIKSRK